MNPYETNDYYRYNACSKCQHIDKEVCICHLINYMRSNKFVIGLDFDSSIVKWAFPNIGEPIPGAFEWLHKFQDIGILFVLNTMRSNNEGNGNVLKEAVDFVESKGIKLYGINNNPDQNGRDLSNKVLADLYIDDLAVGCPLIYEEGQPKPYVDWSKVGPMILERLEREYNIK